MPIQKTSELGKSTGISTGAAARRSRRSTVAKTWMGDDSFVQTSTAHDADVAGIDQEEAMKVVKCTTRFATIMCIAIACVKVTLYFVTKQAVVRTSALDSLGDLLANCISLYTGYRMTQTDQKKYPAGQSKFQHIGCLVFSTFMFALMFGNALGNAESLVESEDQVGKAAISRFFYQTGDLGTEFQGFEKWHGAVALSDGDFEWTSDRKYDNPVKKFFEKQGSAGEKEFAKEMEDKVTMEEIVDYAAEYENDADEWADLKTQNGFLGICATYKLCLWLYCILHAIPKSKSSVLVALATDKRNDFICTYSVIFATFMAFLFKDGVSKVISEEKVDPFVSLILSCVIMATWIQLMIEHAQILSQEAGNDEFRDGICQLVTSSLEASRCSITAPDEDIKVYHSSLNHTIEVALTVKEDSTPIADVKKTIQLLKTKLEKEVPDVEKVVILIKPQD